jgi:UDP-N-acetylmuramyl pentapeptide phosphotransferase/UDP-N-acetylglucosamine-1-phosphate transferase
MREAALLAAVVAGAGLIACLGTRALIPLLRDAAILDRPNERSLHAEPTPRGGGIAVVGAIVLAWLGLILAGSIAASLLAVLVGVGLLAAVSWRDDRGGLSPAMRLAAQCVAVALVLGTLALMGTPLLTHGRLPLWLDAAVTALLWLWFINLFNFMDGIDGLAGSEAAAIGIGLMLASFATGDDPILTVLAATIAAAAIGFLPWNWPPARIFLGDVGSVPLGYLLGFLLLGVAAEGHWKMALILPLYFLADATITLLRRLVDGERIWTPHRRHFYQGAVQRGLAHGVVVRRVVAADILLIGCGWAAENGAGWFAVAAATAIVLALLASLAGGRRPRPV